TLRLRHPAECVQSLAVQLEKLDLQSRADARSDSGNQLERLSQHLNRVPVRAAHARILCRKHEVADRALVVAAAFEVQSELGGQLLLSSGGSAGRHELFSELAVQSGAARVREPAIDDF